MRSSGDNARGKQLLSFSEISMPTLVMPISRNTSIASLRMGPRQTMSTLISSQANDCTHADGDSPPRRARWISGLWVYELVAAEFGINGTLVGPTATARAHSDAGGI